MASLNIGLITTHVGFSADMTPTTIQTLRAGCKGFFRVLAASLVESRKS